MSLFLCSCVNDLFEMTDYSNSIKIQKKTLQLHNTVDNAWICLDKEVYSIQKNDIELLLFFQDWYGKNIKSFFQQLILDTRDKIKLLEKLKTRKIGILVDF